jgi:hypothetical protein
VKTTQQQQDSYCVQLQAVHHLAIANTNVVVVLTAGHKTTFGLLVPCKLYENFYVFYVSTLHHEAVYDIAKW